EGDVHGVGAGVDAVGVTAAEELGERLAVRLLLLAAVAERVARGDGLVEQRDRRLLFLLAEQPTRRPGRRAHFRAAVDRELGVAAGVCGGGHGHVLVRFWLFAYRCWNDAGDRRFSKAVLIQPAERAVAAIR